MAKATRSTDAIGTLNVMVGLRTIAVHTTTRVQALAVNTVATRPTQGNAKELRLLVANSVIVNVTINQVVVVMHGVKETPGIVGIIIQIQMPVPHMVVSGAEMTGAAMTHVSDLQTIAKDVLRVAAFPHVTGTKYVKTIRARLHVMTEAMLIVKTVTGVTCMDTAAEPHTTAATLRSTATPVKLVKMQTRTLVNMLGARGAAIAEVLRPPARLGTSQKLKISRHVMV